MAEEEGKGITIYDFVIEQKITAFCNSYIHVDEERLADEVFTDIKLRKYFQAYPKTMGDPLIGYLNELTQRHGFRMQTSMTGEPALFVRQMDKTKGDALEETFG